MSLYFGTQKGWFLVDSMPHYHAIVLDLHIHSFKTLQMRFRKSSTLIDVPEIRQHDKSATTHIFENTACNHKTRKEWSSPTTVRRRSCSHRFSPLWGTQKYNPCEKDWEWWWGYWRSEEMVASTKFKLILLGERCFCFSLLQGCWGWWRLCSNIRYAIHPYGCSTGMFRELYDKLVAMKVWWCRTRGHVRL